MKKIIIPIVISLFITWNSFASENNECKAKQYDNKTFFMCLHDHTLNNRSSFWTLDWIFWKVNVKIEMWNDIKYIQKMTNWYVNRCNINNTDIELFLKDLRKWSKWSFSSNDLW